MAKIYGNTITTPMDPSAFSSGGSGGGNSGVHTGTEAPTDENVRVWIDLDEEADIISTEVADTEDGHMVTITDPNGSKSFEVIDGRSITKCQINVSGELVITYSDGTSDNLGIILDDIPAVEGKGISNTEINDNGELIIAYTDGTSNNLGVVIGSDGQDGSSGQDGKTPFIQDGYWWIGDTNTNVKAEGFSGQDGANGETPYIQNGNWWIGNTDTGVKAEGIDGAAGVSATHSWNGTVLTITSASGTSSADLKGETGLQGNPFTFDDFTNEQLASLKGEKGNDGTSITIDSIIESTTDGGNNVITFSDGQNITIKNGSKGSAGSKGQDGKTPIKGIDYFTSTDKTELVNQLITETGVDVIPNYVINEANRVIADIIAKQSTKTFTFAAMSDIHYGNGSYTDGIKHACQALKYIDSRIKLDAVVILGDYTDGYLSNNYDNAIEDFKGVNNLLSGLRFAPNLRQQGNHDASYEEHYPLINRFIQAQSNDVIWGDRFAGYYYKDFEDYKLRIISLNLNENSTIKEDTRKSNGQIACSAQQYQWFIDSLDLSSKTDASEWQILILSHQPLDWYSNHTVYLPQILDTYKKGGTISWTIGGINITGDFKEKNMANLIGNIHGHVHNFLDDVLRLGNINNTNLTDIRRISVPNACYGRENSESYPQYQEETKYTKTQNSATDTAFCVYCIDLVNKKINVIHYGAGYSKEIDYSSDNSSTIVYYSISNNLTNVTSNNSTTTVQKGGSYTAKLSSSVEGDMIVTITMGGRDITDDVYVNGVITISNVTGNIVITASTKVEEKTTYSIANNLTRTLNNNTAISIEEGQSYSATLSANYDDETYVNNATITCTVTMGDADITSEVYNDDTKTININSVSGDIVIKGYAYVNLIPLAIDSDGNPYNNGQGWKTGYRLNSSGTESASSASELEVIGFIPVKIGDIIRFKNIKYTVKGGSTYQNQEYLAFYDANKNKLDSAIICNATCNEETLTTSMGVTREGAPNYYLLELDTNTFVNYSDTTYNKWSNSANMAYFRISAEEITNDSIITINEPID